VKITIKISRNNEIKTIDLEKGSKIQDVLTKINMKPDTLIVMNKNKPIPIDDEVKEGDELTILQVSSGG
jgi:sulfur carrier protein ThiS